VDNIQLIKLRTGTYGSKILSAAELVKRNRRHMNNNPQTTAEIEALAGTTWAQDDNLREITRVENIEAGGKANIYWRKPGGKERANPTSLATFKTWLGKATLIELEGEAVEPVIAVAKSVVGAPKKAALAKQAGSEIKDVSKSAYGVWFTKLSPSDQAPRGKCACYFARVRAA
jgi:hypothetical protein